MSEEDFKEMGPHARKLSDAAERKIKAMGAEHEAERMEAELSDRARADIERLISDAILALQAPGTLLDRVQNANLSLVTAESIISTIPVPILLLLSAQAAHQAEQAIIADIRADRAKKARDQ